jgi:hypothetical protein
MMPGAIFFGLIFIGVGVYYVKYPQGRLGYNLVSAKEWEEDKRRAKRKQKRWRRLAGFGFVVVGLFGVIGGLIT